MKTKMLTINAIRVEYIMEVSKNSHKVSDKGTLIHMQMIADIALDFLHTRAPMVGIKS